MNDWIEDYLNYMQSVKGALPLTITTYRDSLVNAADYFVKEQGSGVNWQSLTTEDFRNWEAEQMQRGYNPSYVKKNMAALRSMYRYLLKEGRVKVDPVRLVKNPKQHKRLPTFVRENEMDRLFEFYDFGDDYLGVRNRTMMLMLYHTGVRAAELIGLDVADIDTSSASLKVTGKGNKQRVIPFGKELCDALYIYIKERTAFLASEDGSKRKSSDKQTALFLNRKKSRINYEELRLMVNEALSAVTTQKRRSPHVLRHTFATAMLAHGAQLEAIQHLLGHETVATTAIYTHTTLAELKEQYAQAHPRNEKK